MHFISEDLEDYVANHSQAEPELLAKLNKEQRNLPKNHATSYVERSFSR